MIINVYRSSSKVSVILIQYGMRMRHIVICGLPRSTIFFPHYLINGTFFEKTLLNIQCVFRFSLQLLSETFFILRRTERDMIINVYWSSCKVPVILVRFQCSLNFLHGFSKNTQIPNLMKIRPVGAKLFHADRQTDRRDKSNSRFSQFWQLRLETIFVICTFFNYYLRDEMGRPCGTRVNTRKIYTYFNSDTQKGGTT